MSSRTVTTQRKRVYVRGSAPERFAAHVIPCPRVSGMTPCLEWQGSRDKKGYGRFNAGTGGAPRFMLAHRFAFELAERRDEIAREVAKVRNWDKPENSTYQATPAFAKVLIDMLIAEQDKAKQ